MELSILSHILFTLFCSLSIFFIGFVCLKKKELLFFTLLAFAFKSFLIYLIFQFPALLNNGFFVDSKAYESAVSKTSQYYEIIAGFPSPSTYDVWETQVSYLYALIVAPFYLLFPSASTGFLLNNFFYTLTLLLLYKAFLNTKDSKYKNWAFLSLLIWPSIFFNSILFIRDGLILLLIITFLFLYERKLTIASFLLIGFCIFLEVQIRWYVGLSMILFIIGDLIIAVGRKNRLLFSLFGVVFLAMIIVSTSYLGFTLESIQGFRNVLTGLEGSYNANSTYLKGFIIDSYPKLLLFIPISVFFFLFSPLIPTGGNPLSLVACLENILLLIMAVYAFLPNRKAPDYKCSSILRKSLLFSVPLLLVYSFGVADSGTAMRQKGFLIFIIVVAFFNKREWVLKN